MGIWNFNHWYWHLTLLKGWTRYTHLTMNVSLNHNTFGRESIAVLMNQLFNQINACDTNPLNIHQFFSDNEVFFFPLFVYCVFVCEHALIQACMSLCSTLVFSFYHVGLRDWPQVLRLDDKHFYPLSHLVLPIRWFLVYEWNKIVR